jgi:pantoate--beta-alanine ligase
MRQIVGKESQAKIDYLAVCDPDTLEPLVRIRERAVLLGAIRIGAIRLIDNLLVTC